MKLIGKTTSPDGIVAELYEPDGGADEVFVEGIQGISLRGPVVKMNWFVRDASLEQKDEKKEIRYTKIRLVLGIDTFFACAEFLAEQAEELKKHPGIRVEKVESKGKLQ